MCLPSFSAADQSLLNIPGPTTQVRAATSLHTPRSGPMGAGQGCPSNCLRDGKTLQQAGFGTLTRAMCPCGHLACPLPQLMRRGRRKKPCAATGQPVAFGGLHRLRRICANLRNLRIPLPSSAPSASGKIASPGSCRSVSPDWRPSWTPDTTVARRHDCRPRLHAAVSSSATILRHGTIGIPSSLRATKPARSSALTSLKVFL